MVSSLIMLGDSITQGWDGTKGVAHPMSYWIGKELNISVKNWGWGGGRIVGDRDSDLLPNIRSVDFTPYDAVSIGYGVNDFDGISDSLDTITKQLAVALETLLAKAPNIQVFGILPTPVFAGVPNQNTVKNSNYTENELIDELTNVYVSHGINVLDWRLDPIITAANHAITLGDGVIHPTQATYDLMGQRVAEFIHNPRTPLEIMQSYKYVMAAFKERQDLWGTWGGRLRMMLSNDGMTWRQLPTAYPDHQVRDPSILKIGDTYYIIFTTGLLRTTDFVHYDDMNWNWSWKLHNYCWAPEFFTDNRGIVRVLYAGNPEGADDQWTMNLYVADFDPAVGPVEGTERQLTGDIISLSTIDGNLTYFNGKYHLFFDDNKTDGTSSLHYATATEMLGPYTTQPANINEDKNSYAFEGPELFLSDELGPRLLLDPFGASNDPKTAWHSAGHLGEAMKPIESPDFLTYGNYQVLSSVNVDPFQIRHAGLMLDIANIRYNYLFRIDNAAYLKPVINQTLTAINDTLLSINGTVADNYGSSQFSVEQVPLITSDKLDRDFRLQMLAAFKVAFEALNTVGKYVSQYNVAQADETLNMSVVPHTLLIDAEWVKMYNRLVTKIEQRLDKLNQTIIDVGL